VQAMRARLGELFSAVWLPLYIALGVAWLLAPALAQEHYGTLRLISNEEAAGIAGAVFRGTDVLAAVLLAFAAWRFGVIRRARFAGWAVLSIAGLSAIDGLFPDTCYIGHASCTAAATFVSGVHDIETLVLAGLLAVLSIADLLRNRRVASGGFVMLQLVAALVLISGVTSSQFMVLMQYGYEVAVIVWLGWFVDSFNTPPSVSSSMRLVRRVVGVWVVLGGILALTAALPHVHFAHQWIGHGVVWKNSLLVQHGVVTGVLMLYVARHLLRGERPALWLLLILLMSQIVKYGVLTPQPIGLCVYGLIFVLLVYSRQSFDRNVEPPSWTSRFADLGVVFAGVAGAALVVIAVVTVTGERAHLVYDIQHVSKPRYHALAQDERHVGENAEARLRAVFVALAGSLIGVSLWSLLQPKLLVPELSARHGRDRMLRLLERHSTSSEDYFKLWPTDKAYFFMPGNAASVAYRVEGGIAFMLADPVAATEAARAECLRAFMSFARRHGWVVCSLLVTKPSRGFYETSGLRTMHIGSSAVVSVENFATEISKDKWWRWQRNRAARNGWSYEVLVPPQADVVLAEARGVSDAWLSREGRTEQGFALGYFDDSYLRSCRLHVLRSEQGQMIAFANELPTFGHVRQVSVDLIRFMPDQDGAMPSLLLHIIEALAGSAKQTFDLGFVPLAGIDNELVRLTKRLSRHRFSSAGLEQFKNKFRPEWQPNYIAYDGDLLDLARIARNLERLFKVD